MCALDGREVVSDRAVRLGLHKVRDAVELHRRQRQNGHCHTHALLVVELPRAKPGDELALVGNRPDRVQVGGVDELLATLQDLCGPPGPRGQLTAHDSR